MSPYFKSGIDIYVVLFVMILLLAAQIYRYFYNLRIKKKRSEERNKNSSNVGLTEAVKSEKSSTDSLTKTQNAVPCNQTEVNTRTEPKLVPQQTPVKKPAVSLRNLGDKKICLGGLHSLDMLQSISDGKNPVSGKSFTKLADLQAYISYALKAVESDLSIVVRDAGGAEFRSEEMHSLVMLKSVANGFNPITNETIVTKSELQSFATFATKALKKELGVIEQSITPISVSSLNEVGVPQVKQMKPLKNISKVNPANDVSMENLSLPSM